jgi:dTDP-4-dehydrorhamnose reductase
MKLAVVGAAGLLGQKLSEGATAAGHEVVEFDLVPLPEVSAGQLHRLDITDAGEVERALGEAEPEWVLNAAAYTAVDASEANEENVRSVNVTGVANLLAAADRLGARILTLSTDYVFDGREGPYAEDAPRNPLGIYGVSKAEMEDVIAESGGSHLVVRTMVLYGAAPGVRTNFGLWVLQRLRAGEEVKAVTDQVGNPTLASDLARMLIEMVEEGGSGIYNAAGSDRVSRYEFSMRLAEVFGLEKNQIKPVTTAELGQDADRPLESGFILDRLREDFGIEPLDLDRSLTAFNGEFERYGEVL